MIGLSILSGAHMTIFPRLLELLRAEELDDVLVVAGGTFLPEDIVALEAMGVSKRSASTRRWTRSSATSESTCMTAAWPPEPVVRFDAPEERMDPEERAEIVLAKLRAQIAYAWERSPFYRRRWQACGVSPEALSTLDDLARFPLHHEG